MITAHPDTIREIEEHRASLWTPPPDESICAWAERSLFLSERQTESPGPFSLHSRPYLRGILDCLQNNSVSEISLCCATQVGKSTCAMVAAAHTICCNPGPILWYMPSKDLCLSTSRDRWQSLVEDSPALAAEKPAERFKYSTLSQYFRRCSLIFRGTGSATQTSSTPAKLILLDEVDKFKSSTKKEAHSAKLAEHRADSYSFSKIVRLSTPTTPTGPIWQAWLSGDRRRYFVPCFHCGIFQTLEWKHVKWQDFRLPDGSRDLAKIKASAHYECPHCKKKITDAHKLSMLRRGEWRVTNPAAVPGRVSFHLSGLYAVTVKCTFGALAVKFIEGKDSLEGLQDFVNSVLAEPWTNQSGDQQEILTAPPDAPPLPEAVNMLSVDVQEVSPLFWGVVRSVAKEGHSRLVCAFHADDWESIRRVQQAFSVADHHVIVDSGFRGSEVYLNCLRFGRLLPRLATQFPMHVGWIPAKGRERDALWVDKFGKRPSPWFYSRASINPSTRIELPLLEFNSDVAHDILQKLRQGPEKSGGMRWEICQLPCPVEVPGVVMVDETEYLHHLTAMVRKPFAQRNTLRVVWKWVKRSSHVPNHLSDAEVQMVVWMLAHKRLVLRAVAEEEKEDEKEEATAA